MYPETKFIVLSDLHYYDMNLGVTGAAFEKARSLRKEIKMVSESPDILESAIDASEEDADFVMICGDLTMEGEGPSHKKLAETLSKLLHAGLKVFVINGNHDIYNPRASSYSGDKRLKVESISPGEFSQIYGAYGYREALDRDEGSLSYVAEPIQGLWVLAIDSCRWREKYSESGKIYRNTFNWLRTVLNRARENGKTVMGMMHHGVLEHYRGNRKYFGDFIVENHQKISQLFMEYNVNLVFTGHFHAQDVALARDGSRYLYDIETGSLVTYPCPYRVITIDNRQVMRIETRYITSTTNHPTGFRQYAFRQSYDMAERLAIKTLRKWRVRERDARRLAPQIVRAFRAHGTGNEDPGEEVIKFQGIGWWGKAVMSLKKPLLESLWEQSPVPDNHLSIDLSTGHYLPDN